MKRAVFLGMCLLFLVSCTTSGGIDTAKSKLGDTLEMEMTPGWCTGGKIRLGLFWSSRLKGADDLIMTAVVDGVQSFAPGESLRFIIDGQKVSLVSLDRFPEIENTPASAFGNIPSAGSTSSSMRYRVDRDLVRRLINAEEVFVRVELSRTYIEDGFSSDFYKMTKPAFRQFLERLETDH